MFKTIAVSLVVATAVSTAQDTDSIPGGYNPIPVTQDKIELLEKALSSAQYDGHKPSPSICVNQVFTLQEQIVAGWNYKYLVDGCKLPKNQYVGHCPPGCHGGPFEVVVFEQPWTNTLLVSSISRME